MNLTHQGNAMAKIQFFSDKLAVAISSLCVLHCIATPLLLIAVPSLASASMLSDETFHRVLLFFVIPIGAVALTIGYSHHKQIKVLAAGIVGLTLLSTPILIEASGLDHEVLGETGEVYITVLASFIIVAAHFINFNLRKRHQSTQETSV